jgi:hypothetical protein
MLFGPGVKNITVANITKAMKSECDMARPYATFAGVIAKRTTKISAGFIFWLCYFVAALGFQLCSPAFGLRRR